MMKLFVGNLSFSTTQDDVLQAFSPYGNVESVNLLTDRTTGQSRGFGFVEMSDRTEAQNAINALNGAQLNGRAMNVNEARPKTEGGGGGFGGGGNKSRGGFGGNRGARRDPRW
jgi:RNA recognition motif-containing protein